MHGVEDVLPLDADGQTPLLPGLVQPAAEFHNGGLAAAEVHQHDHDEIFLKHRLADVQDVDVLSGQQGADGGDDAYLR